MEVYYYKLCRSLHQFGLYLTRLVSTFHNFVDIVGGIIDDDDLQSTRFLFLLHDVLIFSLNIGTKRRKVHIVKITFHRIYHAGFLIITSELFVEILITARVRSTTGWYCFHRCLSVHRGGGVRSVQLRGGSGQSSRGGGSASEEGVRSVQLGGGGSASGGSGQSSQGGVRSVQRGGQLGRGVSQDRTTE